VLDLHAAKRVQSTKILARKHRQELGSDLVTVCLRIAGQNAVININSYNREGEVILPNRKNTLVRKKLLETMLPEPLSQKV
jgi:hypothetical protein